MKMYERRTINVRSVGYNKREHCARTHDHKHANISILRRIRGEMNAVFYLRITCEL